MSLIDDIRSKNVERSKLILKAFGEDEVIEKAVSKYGQQKHAEKVTVTRNGKTFQRQQAVGGGKEVQQKEKQAEQGKPEQKKQHTLAQLSKFAKESSLEDLQHYIKTGTDSNLRKVANLEVQRRDKEESGKKEDKKQKEEKNAWLKDYTAYKLSRLPINIPQKEVALNLSGDTDSHWVMKWIDPKTGKELRSYTQGFMKKNADYKWERIQGITSKDIDNVKKVASKAIKSQDKKEQQIGAVLSIISNTGLRIGSKSGFEETQNRGVTTLSADNIKINGDSISLEFKGKSYKNNTAEFKDKELAEYLTVLKKENKGEEFLFNNIEDSHVRDYFHENVNKDWKIKDMRTFVATDMARKILFDDKEAPPPLPEKGVRKLIQDKLTNVYKKVSDQLNNSPSMAKNSYIHPKVTEEWLKHIGAVGLL